MDIDTGYKLHLEKHGENAVNLFAFRQRIYKRWDMQTAIDTPRVIGKAGCRKKVETNRKNVSERYANQRKEFLEKTSI